MNFHEFDIPTKLNGEQLKAELGCDEVYIREDKLIIGGSLTREEAEAGLAVHIPIPPKEITIVERLEIAGITIPELKKALGL